MALDSAATNGVTPWEDMCTNIRTEENQMVCGGGNLMNSRKVGDLKLNGRNREMKNIELLIKDMFIDPKSEYTLISSTKATKSGGFEIIQRGKIFALVNKRGDNIIFNKSYETKKGFLACMENKLQPEHVNTRREKRIDINEAHRILSHASPDTTRITAKELAWNLTGELQKCKDCSLAKIRAKTITKKVRFKQEHANKGLNISLDISKGAGERG